MTDKPDHPVQELGTGPRIVVIGVGGAGGNAVNNMINAKLAGVEFAAANTDAQALGMSLSQSRIQMGRDLTQGLGAGSRPDIGRAAAEESLEDILRAIEDANMVFITAGMGGGTGTGSAPIIAKAARESGVLTVGVVTKPFHFEGTRRMSLAEAGIEEMAEHVDTLIVIPNQNLFRVANEKTTFADAFKMADDVLHAGVRGVTDLMVTPGLINLDFADVRAVMTEMGKAIMGSGEAEGENRALAAAEAAISNPLLDEISMKGARGVLINITGGMDLTLFEIDQAANRIRDEVDPDANIIFGSTFNENLAGRMRVSLVAAGIDAEEGARDRPARSKRPIVSLYSERAEAGARDIADAARTEEADASKDTDDRAEAAESAQDEPSGGETPDASQPRRTSAPVFPFRARTRERKGTETSSAPNGPVQSSVSPSLVTDRLPDTQQPGAQDELRVWSGPKSEPNYDAHLDSKAEEAADQGVDSGPPASGSTAASDTPTDLAFGQDDGARPAGHGQAGDTADTPALVLDTPIEASQKSPEMPGAQPNSPVMTQSDAPADTQSGGDVKPKKSGGFFSWIASGGGGDQAEDLFKKADRYYHGQGVRKNLELALRSYLKAAESGHPGAQNRVGWMYEKGEGVKTDHAEAAKWYRKAAEQGYVNAMNDLGYMYRQGWGVPQSHEDALLWFELAASKYDSYAEYNMGQMFENGWGVERDMEEAVRWFRRSAARGHERAAKRLEELGIKT